MTSIMKVFLGAMLSSTLILFSTCETIPLIQPPAEMQLRYGVRPGNQFEMKITMRGKMTSQTSSGQTTQNDMLYELVALQIIEGGNTGEAFIVRMQPLPERTRLLVNGEPQSLVRESLPVVTVKLSRLGELKEVAYEGLGGRTAAGAETIEMSGLFNSLPQLPAEHVAKGARWPVMPGTSLRDFIGEAVLIGTEMFNGHQCARMKIHTSKRLVPEKELANAFNAKGWVLEGFVQNNSDLFFALQPGWPLFGTGKTIYETVIKQGEKVVNMTHYEFESAFEIKLP